VEIHTSFENLSKLKPAIAIGVFDGVHLGHKKLLSLLKSEAKALNAPSMVLTFWPHPYIHFNPEDKKFRLLMSLREKEMLLSDLGIDHLLILPFDNELAYTTADDFVQKVLVDGLNIRHLVVGDDHRFGKERAGTYESVKRLAGKFGFGISGLDSFTSGEVRISSTFIRSCLLAGDLASANKLLGYPYFIIGIVEPGEKIGRQIGFPTANISCCEGWKQIPQDGVYVVKVKWNGSEFGGMLNIGTRPTVENTGKKSIEVHLFEHIGELYGEELKVSFFRRLRDEMRFNNLDDLRDQLEKDKINALAVLKQLEV